MARLIVALLLVAVAVQAKDYCQYKCNNGSPNLACGHSEKPAANCVNFNKVTIGTSEKQMLLDEHNNYRSRVAKGDAKPLPAAKNMNELVWDDDLAYLASLNVLQCKMNHDNCRDTETHNGQNLYQAMTSASYLTDKVIKDGVKAWYDEIKDVKVSEINKFTGGGGAVIGHFTQVTWAKSTRVGCAMSNYMNGKWNSYLLACNYVNGNMVGESVYDAGTTCSACKTCSNGLCKQ